ncbi:MAG: L-2-amino-thiazoline-4-carboxylic acid hydrolase [Thermodesulfobacteriota bacterium]
MKEKGFHQEQFARAVALAGPAVLSLHGRERGESILSAARKNFGDLLPGLPAHRTLLSWGNFTGAPIALAYYRAVSPLMVREQALADTQTFMTEVLSGIYSSLPAAARRVLRIPGLFELGLHALLRRDTWADDPQGWIFHVLPRQPGHLFDFDVTRCGVHRYLSEQGAPELTSRAICPLDDWFAENALPPGTRLSRATYLSRGDSCCSFRYLKPGA